MLYDRPVLGQPIPDTNYNTKNKNIPHKAAAAQPSSSGPNPNQTVLINMDLSKATDKSNISNEEITDRIDGCVNKIVTPHVDGVAITSDIGLNAAQISSVPTKHDVIPDQVVETSMHKNAQGIGLKTKTDDKPSNESDVDYTKKIKISDGVEEQVANVKDKVKDVDITADEGNSVPSRPSNEIVVISKTNTENVVQIPKSASSDNVFSVRNYLREKRKQMNSESSEGKAVEVLMKDPLADAQSKDTGDDAQLLEKVCIVLNIDYL